MNVRTKHWTLKPHRNMRQHKVFLRHELLKYNSEKSTAKSSALENYISSANLSLSGCSSAEPNSVSVGRCKFQLKKLYLQTVKKVDHLPLLSISIVFTLLAIFVVLLDIIKNPIKNKFLWIVPLFFTGNIVTIIYLINREAHLRRALR